jgi:hypothetical protein
MANESPLNTPVLWINKYLQSKLSDFGFSGVPFFPTSPSTINDLTSTFQGLPGANGVMGTYDRMFKMNRKSFPHIKCEQLLYYFYATESNSIPNMVQVTEIIYRLLDRFDESAQEINDWCSNRRVNIGTAGTPDLVDNIFYFHNFRVYQLEETRDIIDFGTARTYAGNKIIIEFDYHQKPVENADGKDTVAYTDWTPEPRLSGDDKITI